MIYSPAWTEVVPMTGGGWPGVKPSGVIAGRRKPWIGNRVGSGRVSNKGIE